MPSNCIIISWKSKKEMGICRCPVSASGYRLSAFGCRLSASRCYCLLDSTPECKRVQAPSAPGFYRSCASRRTMGSGRNRLRLPAWFRGSYKCCQRQRCRCRRHKNFIARRAPPHPLNPLNPHAAGVSMNPLNPGRGAVRKICAIRRHHNLQLRSSCQT